MQEATNNSILEELIEIAEKKKLSMKIEYTRNGIYIIRDVKGVLPVMVSNDKIHWKLGITNQGTNVILFLKTCHPEEHHAYTITSSRSTGSTLVTYRKV